jgi:hypothetical protein
MALSRTLFREIVLTKKRQPIKMAKDRMLFSDILELNLKHPRYGCRRITIKLRERNWRVNFKREYVSGAGKA